MNVSHFTASVLKPRQATPNAELLDAEALMKEKKYGEAKNSLLKLDLSDAFVRKFLLESSVQSDDYDIICKVFYPPQNIEEAVHLLSGLLQLNNKKMMAEYMEHPLIKNSVDPAVIELRNKIGAICHD